MARIGEAEIKQQLIDNSIANAYMIYGEENYLKEFYVNKIKKAVVDPAFEDFNLHCYEGKAVGMTELLQDADMLPMMSERSLILVHDYPLDKSAKDVEELKAYLKDMSETCVLVFWFDNIEVNEKKQDSKWRGIINAFAKHGEAVELKRRTESELAKLIASSAKKRKCSIDMGNARYLISVVGSDIKTIFNELEKLCGYVGQGEITKEVIDKLAVKCLQARVYDLSRLILSGNGDSAYNALNALFAMKEDYSRILAIIASNYVDMYRVKCAKSAGLDEKAVVKEFNYKGREFVVGNASRDCRSVSIRSMRMALDVLSEADEKIKSTSIDKGLVLEETIAKLLMIRNV